MLSTYQVVKLVLHMRRARWTEEEVGRMLTFSSLDAVSAWLEVPESRATLPRLVHMRGPVYAGREAPGISASDALTAVAAVFPDPMGVVKYIRLNAQLQAHVDAEDTIAVVLIESFLKPLSSMQPPIEAGRNVLLGGPGLSIFQELALGDPKGNSLFFPIVGFALPTVGHELLREGLEMGAILDPGQDMCMQLDGGQVVAPVSASMYLANGTERYVFGVLATRSQAVELMRGLVEEIEPILSSLQAENTPAPSFWDPELAEKYPDELVLIPPRTEMSIRRPIGISSAPHPVGAFYGDLASVFDTFNGMLATYAGMIAATVSVAAFAAHSAHVAYRTS